MNTGNSKAANQSSCESGLKGKLGSICQARTQGISQGHLLIGSLWEAAFFSFVLQRWYLLSNWSDQRVCFFWLVNLKGAFFLIGPYRRDFFFFFLTCTDLRKPGLPCKCIHQTKETLVKYPWHQGDPPLEKGGYRHIKRIKEDRLRFRRNGKFWIQSKVWNSDKLCLIFYLFLIGVPRE